jgi:V8-like Glu-specific endopeptidase
MHRTIKTTAVSGLVAIVVATGTVAIGAPVAARNADPSQPVSSPTRFALSGAEDPAEYWTPWRIAQAKPMKIERKRNKPKITESDETGQRARVDLGTDIFDEPRVVRASENQPSAVYPFPFNRRTVEKQIRRVAPYRQVGRIFFRRGGQKYSCSGASVTGGKRNVVFTAGHCLNDGGNKWSTDVVFIPGRKDGKRKNPYGKFVARELWVPSGWQDNKWWAYDMGAFSVFKNRQTKKTLRQTVGALGFAYNQGRIQHFDAFGYPAQGKFKGNKLITCSSAHAVDDANENGPDSMGIGCDMTAGASGGPWIVALRRRNLLNGVTSYGYPEQPAGLYSPYFDNAANNLRCAAGTGNEDATSC